VVFESFLIIFCGIFRVVDVVCGWYSIPLGVWKFFERFLFAYFRLDWNIFIKQQKNKKLSLATCLRQFFVLVQISYF